MLVKNRIKSHQQFQEIIAKGELIRSKYFTFYILENKIGFIRIGISVPKKSGNAVIRNKIKRQIRAIFARNNDYTKSLDLIVIIRKNYDVGNFAEIEHDLQNFLKSRTK